MSDMVNLKINGMAVSVPKGTTILEAPNPSALIFRLFAT